MTALRTILMAGVAALAVAGIARGEAHDFDAAMAAMEAGQPARAVAIFADLAASGDLAAQLNLSVLTARGEGIPQNDLDAAYWAWRARLGGLSAAAATADALLNRLAPETVETLSSRLAADLETLAETGEDWAFLALARLELQLAPQADLARAYEFAALAAAFSVAGAAALRDALAGEIATDDRLAAQERATARFRSLCAEGSRPACAAIPNADAS